MSFPSPTRPRTVLRARISARLLALALPSFVALVVVSACGLDSTTIGGMNAALQGDAALASDGSHGDAALADGASLDVAQLPEASVDAGDGGVCAVPTYPAGPYGVLQGQIVPPTPSWQGYVGGSSSVSTITPADYFDPAFCRGSHVLYIVEIDASDPTAVTATTDTAQNLAGPWAAGSVRALLLVTRSSQGALAKLSDTLAWKQTYGVTWDIATDPGETFQDQTGFYPQIRVVVDACTMQVIRWVHRDDVSADVLALANRAACP
jgi:hypothetical protein